MEENDELKQEIEDRLKALKNCEVVEKMKRKAFYVPFMAMAASLGSLYIGRRVINRPGVTLRRPVLFQFGMGILGAVFGAQLGALWLQREYFKLDPQGKTVAELRAISELSKKDNCNRE